MQNNLPQNNHQLQLDWPLSVNSKSELTLWRYPKQPAHSPLQAWDNADILLAKTANDILALNESPKNLAIINDQFGAICCLLSDYNLDIYQDSKIGRLATIENLKNNQCASDCQQFKHNLAELKSLELVLIKIPKNLDYLEDILAYLHQHAPDHCQIIASAKTNHINKSVVKLFNRYFSQVNVSLAEKKARTINAQQKQNKPYSSFTPWLKWQVDSGLQITNAANVFSRSSLDIGAAFMLEHLPCAKDKTVIDLACGNGVLGLHLIEQQPSRVIFSDESFQAIESAEKNVQKNHPDYHSHCEFIWQDCLSEQVDESADLIICNPPFHQQHTITAHIAQQMFSDALRVLKPAGELIIVGNRHLGYHKTLTDLFGQCSLIASNQKFVIIKAIK